jgi:hypothetical protein
MRLQLLDIDKSIEPPEIEQRPEAARAGRPDRIADGGRLGDLALHDFRAKNCRSLTSTRNDSLVGYLLNTTQLGSMGRAECSEDAHDDTGDEQN